MLCYVIVILHMKEWKEKKSCVSLAYRMVILTFEKEMRWMNWEGVYMIKSRGQEQIHARRHKTDREKRNYFHISHGKDERTDKIWISQGQCQLFQTTRKDETTQDDMVNSIKCSRQVKKTDMIFLRAYGIAEVVMDIQNSRLSSCLLYTSDAADE